MKFIPVETQPFGLNSLSGVRLTPPFQARLDRLAASNTGNPAWRNRKTAEARQLLALEQIASYRIRILEFDVSGSLRVVFALHTPVPCRPDAEQQLVVAPEAVLGLDYPSQAVLQAMPGSAFLTVLHPREVWHANVALPGQSLCLGAKLPAGIRVRALVMMAYGALSGQTMQQVDPHDAAGVMNVEAAAWWQQNLNQLPLSPEPFLIRPQQAQGDES